MKRNVNSKYSSYCLFGKKFLFLFSLFFISVMAFCPLILEVNGGFIPMNIIVNSEDELKAAIDAAPTDRGYAIDIGTDIALKESLEIPKDKTITLRPYRGRYSLVGCDGMDTITVKSGGRCSLSGGLVVTHAKGAVGRGVYVERDGELYMTSCTISGNSATQGGGVYNEGICILLLDYSGFDILICNNSATLGGGVYNVGTFEMYSGKIQGNICVDTEVSMGEGGGVYNVGVFEMIGRAIGNNDEDFCEISGNSATQGGGVYNEGTFEWVRGVIKNNTLPDGTVNNVYYAEGEVQGDGLFCGDWWLYLVALLVIGVIAGSLLVYRSKKPKPSSVVYDLTDSVVV